MTDKKETTETGPGSSILLVGNPNVGKSVIFSYLTGRYVIVSNYPGTTVELSSGHLGSKSGRKVIDTPGVNSLFPASEDERVTRDIIYENPQATVVQVADAKNIYRALFLTSQLAEAGCRLILVLNMMDEARQRGIHIDCGLLARRLGIEVIETVAVEKRGLSKLTAAINSGREKHPDFDVKYPAMIDEIIEKAVNIFPDLREYGTFGALTLVSADRGLFENDARFDREKLDTFIGDILEREEHIPEPFSYYIASSRKAVIEEILTETVARDTGNGRKDKRLKRGMILPATIAVVTALLFLLFGRSALADAGLMLSLPLLFILVTSIAIAGAKRVDRYTLHPFYGGVILLAVIFLIYQFVGLFAAGTLVDLMENSFFGKLVLPAMERISGEGFMHDLLLGEYGLVSMGLRYSVSIVLPIVVVFFLVFGILEDSGYFPRLTVLTNRIFRVVGVNGKATLPVVLGFGCVTMAILASRILETRKERIIVITLLSLAVPCSAQLGVTMALMAAISIKAVVTIGLIVLLEFLAVGAILGKYLEGKTSDFILELPPLRVPRVSNIVLKTGARAKWFLVEAVPYFLLATLVLFTLHRTGAMVLLYRAVEPVTSRFLGLPIDTASVFIIGFFRRDYGAAGLYSMWQNGMLSGNQIVVALTVMSLFLPCLASLIVMIKEIGIKYGFVIFFFVMFLSILTGGLLNLTLQGLNINF